MTVSHAIHRGYLIITLPCICVIAGMPFAVPMVMAANGYSEHILLYAAIGFVAGILLAVAYGTLVGTKWRIWAFTNVQDIHELERRAIEARLIYPRGHRFAKWVIAGREEKQKLAHIDERLQAPSTSKKTPFIDDPTVPSQTIIYHAKWSNLFMALIGFGCIVIGIEAWGNRGNIIGGLLLILFGGRFAWKALRRLFDRNPQIVMNDEGIQVRDLKFHPWERITDEEIGLQGYGKYAYVILSYSHRKQGKYIIPIGSYDISSKRLEHLLEVYRGRYNAK